MPDLTPEDRKEIVRLLRENVNPNNTPYDDCKCSTCEDKRSAERLIGLLEQA